MHKYKKGEVSCLSLQGVKQLTKRHTTQQPVFLLLSARLNFNIPLEKEPLHNDNNQSIKQVLMFSTGQETTNKENLLLTHIWESECLGVGAYLHCVANSFPSDILVAHY